MGSYRMHGKGVFYQQSAEVPLMIHLPGQTVGRRVSGNFSHIHLLPTLLDLLGKEVPSDLSGHSCAESLSSGELPEEDIFLFWHPQNREAEGHIKGQSWRGIVSPNGWKYAVSPEEEIGLLFNLNEDPWEERNLFLESEHSALRQELHHRLITWMEQEQDLLPVDDLTK